MKKKSKIVYIIPTYNESENIFKMLGSVRKVLSGLTAYKFNILVVDDKSPDGTPEIVSEFRLKHPEIVLLSGSKNGLGQAMIRGINFAIKKLKADIVVSNEADFSYSPTETFKMVKRIENGTDVVFASRKLSNVHTWSIERQIIHWVANVFFANWIAGVNEVQDHNSAFKAIRVKNVLDKLNLNKFPKGFAFFNYLTFRLLKTTKKYYELTTMYHPRTQGESKISLKPKYFKTFIRDALEYILVSFRIRLERFYS